MLWEVLSQMMGLELCLEPSEAWLIAGRAPGTCSRELLALEPREDMEPVENDPRISHTLQKHKILLNIFGVVSCANVLVLSYFKVNLDNFQQEQELSLSH